MKRLIVCCDGTWQSLDNEWPTNVQRMVEFVVPSGPDATAQVVYYDAGIGTTNLVDKLGGGAFGHGLDHEIREAYRFLSLNFEPGDEIYLFGFSRGAYTVRSLAGLVNACGIVARDRIRRIPRAMDIYRDRTLRPGDDEAIRFREDNAILEEQGPPRITFLGCWDTVGALGVPDLLAFLPIDDWMSRKYEFHDTTLGGHVLHARHAVAVDERRKVFDVTRMTPPGAPAPGFTLEERWFPGTHGCVGGGERGVRALSDGPLVWMINEARAVGLVFDTALVDRFTRSDPLAPFEDSVDLRHRIFGHAHDRRGPEDIAALSDELILRWQGLDDYRPETLAAVAHRLDAL
ncbi:MAG: DUF2235 domain-containing protein [Pseudomonadota bacterium]